MADLKVLYFAWLRGRIGHGEEAVALAPDIATVGDLVRHLGARGGAYGDAFADPTVIRAAVNQDFADFDHPLRPGDEVALFPPVTGG